MFVHMVISGRVQGVGFRYSARQKALELGLVGWVQNKADGTVEIEVEGDEINIEVFINEIKAGLHSFIRVDHIDISKSNQKVGYHHFKVK